MLVKVAADCWKNGIAATNYKHPPNKMAGKLAVDLALQFWAAG
ncbi:MAG: hypothetical protein U5K00_21950 [Melioribacteraceae bacterium]|nr:hypothetical protein [Melioribacteraceae bacterium]